MNTTPSAGDEATREALMKVLAGASRNALARVELAASELARFETSPSHQDRVSRIRTAVEEIDDLLAKIDALAEPRLDSQWEPVDLQRIARRVCARLSPSLGARGATIDWRPSEEVLPVSIPASALEALVCTFVRVSLSLIELPGRLDAELSLREGHACFVLRGPERSDGPRPPLLERETRIELEVELAEWNGLLLSASNEGVAELGFAFATGAADE